MKINILKYDDLGNGICKIDNKVCFVKKAIPKELVDIKILKNNKNYSVATINKIIKKSNKRIDPICPFYNQCGGCNFLHIKDSEEKEFKKEKIKKYFSKLDEFYETDNLYYRNKIILHVKNGKIGLYNEKSNDLIEINYCYLISSKMNEIINLFNKSKDINFNGKILIRENSNNEIMVSIDGIYNYIDKISNSNVIDNLIYNAKVLKGNNYFIENILDYKFKVSYQSFFQVNRIGLEKIIIVLDNFFKDKKIDKALDLYSGTSILGIFIAKYANKVISIESNSSSTNDAKENVKLNQIDNLEIINGLVEDYIEKFNNINLIIVDPSRRGIDKKTISYLNIINSKYIIYIACGIDSLKRDLKLLEENYKIENIYGIDMFPKTNKIETIAILNNKK